MFTFPGINSKSNIATTKALVLSTISVELREPAGCTVPSLITFQNFPKKVWVGLETNVFRLSDPNRAAMFSWAGCTLYKSVQLRWQEEEAETQPKHYTFSPVFVGLLLRRRTSSSNLSRGDAFLQFAWKRCINSQVTLLTRAFTQLSTTHRTSICFLQRYHLKH